MGRASIITAILLVALSFEAQAIEFEKVIVRPDGKIEDNKGKIIAIPNVKDQKNNDYETYYYDASKECPDGLCASDFAIIYHPDYGYIKKPKFPEAGDAPATSGDAPEKNNNVTNKTSSGGYIPNPYITEPDMSPRY